jgi:hypothetical protein
MALLGDNVRYLHGMAIVSEKGKISMIKTFLNNNPLRFTSTSRSNCITQYTGLSEELKINLSC